MSGGGSSGSVDYPDYMKDFHELWLNQIGAEIRSGRNPFDSSSAFNPNNYINNAFNELSSTKNLASEITYSPTYNNIRAYVDSYSSYFESEPSAVDEQRMIDSYAEIVMDRFNNDRIPQFEAGMRDINAVQSSAFVIGRGFLLEEAERQISEFTAKVKLDYRNAFYNRLVGFLGVYVNAAQVEASMSQFVLEYRKAMAHMYSDLSRVSIVSEKEYQDARNLIMQDDDKWYYERYNYAGNLLASIGSASVQTGITRNPIQSALGGAISGVAMGFMTGNPINAAIGGALGAAGGLLS